MLFTSGDRYKSPENSCVEVAATCNGASTVFKVSESGVVASCAGAASALALPSPSISKIAMASPTFATSSFCLRIFTIFPETGVGTSESTLSVAISTTESSSFTLSPSLNNQLITVASITPSPMEGSNNLYSAIFDF